MKKELRDRLIPKLSAFCRAENERGKIAPFKNIVSQKIRPVQIDFCHCNIFVYMHEVVEIPQNHLTIIALHGIL